MIRILLLLSVIIFVFLRLLFIPYNFWGQEYEDSFIYYDNARNFYHELINEQNIFQCFSIGLGSYDNMESYYTYGAHYSTFSYIIYLFNIVFGENPINIFIVNLLISLIILIVIFLNESNNRIRLISIVLLSLTPFYSIYCTSGNSEIFSSLFLILTFYFNNKSFTQNNTIYFFLSLVTACLATLTNRENLILFPIISIIILINSKPTFTFKNLNRFFIIICLIISLVLLLEIHKTEYEYSNDIASRTFSLLYLWDNTKAFFQGAFQIKLWGITGYLMILSIILFFKNSRWKNRKNKTLAIYLIAYYLITFTHYRHLNYLETGIVYPIETIRYTTTFFPIIILFIAENIYDIRMKIPSVYLYGMASFIFIYLGIQSIQLRKEMSFDENFTRIQPAKEILKLAKEGDLIVSEFSIIERIYSTPNTIITEIRDLENIKTENYNSVYILLNKEQDQNLLKKFNLLEIKKINNMIIYKLQK